LAGLKTRVGERATIAKKTTSFWESSSAKGDYTTSRS